MQVATKKCLENDKTGHFAPFCLFYYHASIYDNIPAQLNNQNRKFNFTMLNSELKSDRYEDSFLWLKDAAVAVPAYIVSTPQSPLEMSKETNVFKLYLNDVGLLTSCYPYMIRQQLAGMDPDLEINNGALFENHVAQEFYAGCGKAFSYKKEKYRRSGFHDRNRRQTHSC